MQQYSYFELPNKRRFGVELEVSNNVNKQYIGEVIRKFEKAYTNPSRKRKRSVKITSGLTGWAQTRRNAYWHVKYDSTCGPSGKSHDFGWEIASFIGMGIDDINHISSLAKFLCDEKLQTNLNCGLHIHVEVKDFSPNQIGVLLARWLKIESLLISICHPSRNQNSYCRSIRSVFECYLAFRSKKILSHDFVDPINLWNFLKPTDTGTHNNYDKKVTLNTVGFALSQKNPSHSRCTVELRLPECLLNEIHIKNWIVLILNFIEKSKNGSYPTNLSPVTSLFEALNYLGLFDDNNFAFLDPELQNLKLWFLSKVINCKENRSMASQAKKLFEFATLI